MKQSSKSSFSNFLSSYLPRVVCLLLAIVVFVISRYMNMSDRVVRVPLEVTLPVSAEIEAESTVPSYIDVVISGNDNLVYLVDPDSIKASADFSHVSSEGIARVPVILEYYDEAYDSASLVVTAKPDVVRILFREK